MMFEPGDRVKLAEVPRAELERRLAVWCLSLTRHRLLRPGEEAIIEHGVEHLNLEVPAIYTLVGSYYNYYYPEAALQHACNNWQLHRELRRVAATTEVAPTGVDRSAYLTGMTESLEVR